MRYPYWLLALTLCLSSVARAVDIIELQGLFSGKAVINIDGQRRVLAEGETSPEGITLVSVNAENAVLKVDGNTSVYRLGSTVGLSYTRPEDVEEQFFADDRGMFESVGTINGRSVRFLVDTGATTVAMNKSQAKQLGIRYRIDGDPASVSTASGYEKAWRIKLKSVSLGKIKQYNVDAMVIDGKHPGPILLGMSFLDKLKVEKTGNILLLKQRK
jgi:aspartyl protease family protein